MQHRFFHFLFIALVLLTLAILIYKWTNPARITAIDIVPSVPAQFAVISALEMAVCAQVHTS
ncbi:MAG: hypothetical protein ACK5MY_15810 [Jhaorihella sp.]